MTSILHLNMIVHPFFWRSSPDGKRSSPEVLPGHQSSLWAIDPLHRSQNASDIYPTMHHFVTEMCTHVHISVTKWCTVGYGTGDLADLWTTEPVSYDFENYKEVNTRKSFWHYPWYSFVGRRSIRNQCVSFTKRQWCGTPMRFLLVWIVYWTTSRVTGYFRRHDTCVMSLYCHTVHVCCGITYSRWNMQLNRVALWVWVQSIPKLILQQTSGTRGLLVVVSCIVFCFGQYWSIYPYTSGSVVFCDGLRFQD